MKFLLSFPGALVVIGWRSSVAFEVSPPTTTRSTRRYHPTAVNAHSRSRVLLFAQKADSEDTSFSSSSLNGEPSSTSPAAPAAASGIISMSDAKSQLFSSFAALELPDQYDAVLTGLCAKILDGSEIREEAAVEALKDPIQLLDEMNRKRIQASPRSLMAMIDATVKTQDAETMARILSLARKNRGIDSYGSLQADIMNLPTSPTSRVKCPDGKMKTRSERLADVPDIPTDDRGQEVTSAFAFAAVVGACLFADFFRFDDITPFSNLLLAGIVALGVVDNFYDVISTVSSVAAKQVNKDKDDESADFEMPKKESLPLGLGSGEVTGSVVRGLSRLLTVDAERESQCEAAALFVAYQLGLPCFAFRPNALESSVLLIESTRNDELDSLDSSTGIMRILIWLLAPVAMESAKHSQLIMSDPREAKGFLGRLEDYVEGGGELTSIWWLDYDQEKADLLKWAYTEADLMLRENRAVVTDVAQCLTGGAATIGDCVAVMERW